MRKCALAIRSRIYHALATAHELSDRFPQCRLMIGPKTQLWLWIGLQHKQIRIEAASVRRQLVGPGQIGSPDTGAPGGGGPVSSPLPPPAPPI